ncbi:M20 family metallopeptidase [Alicyclobacillus ferrooxydans]|uniref:Peptidase M20 dimerisation domain-containing protein n=1 Tax=Alicyclobacillus ferrooxydans TaxID=471514 RepID=A0A0P9CXG6_9BACL|nr:M20 family metallopeptidase [Alicyclobacillus ferrooxydans]KPV44449.1 hypothetical protein AN477_07515 [Alicyclobacillus ferrooxydans]
MDPILSYLVDHQQEMLADLRTFVCTETPSTDKDRLDKFAEFLRSYAEGIGGQVEVLESTEYGNHLRIEWGMDRDSLSSSVKPVLLVGHFDTVWSLGTLETMPFQIDANGRVSGPGIFDMKGGLVQGFWAIRALREVTRHVPPIVFLCNADEEIGSRSSRPFIEAEAKRASAALILEASQDGKLKTARKGVGIYHVTVEGKAAHAGLDPLAGVSAIEEMAHQILTLHAQTDMGVGTTVNVGVVQGGTRSNVTAPSAEAEVDLRVVTTAEANRMNELILGLEAHNPRAKVRVTGDINRPPMERTEATAKLFGLAKSIAADLGFDVDEVAVGGGSDGNFCAAVGTPVLDGLGAVGGGAHAVHEHLIADEMPRRAALLARLIEQIATEDPNR